MKAGSALAALVLLLGSSSFVSAQGAQGAQTVQSDQTAPARPVPQVPVFRAQSSVVSLNVSVTDGGTKYVSGLQPTDFAVYEDGIKQDVRFFEAAKVPVDLIVLIDTSSSMSDKMDVVHEAAIGFLRTLRPEDRGAIVTFANNVNVLQPLTADRAALERAVRQTTAKGNTALYNAVYIALRQFAQPARVDGDVRRQAVVVLSDGEDTASMVSFDDVLAQARRSGVNIYTVSLESRYDARQQEDGIGRRFQEADYSMKMLARETGGQSFFPRPDALRAVYANIATELAHQYSIGYVPANQHSDGGFRRVIVQIVTRPSLHPRTRVGYTADKME